MVNDDNIKKYWFKSALVEVNRLQWDWCTDVTISIADGSIVDVTPGAEREPQTQLIEGVALPGMVNVHSHAFQRGFVGLSEYRTVQHDSFWTWRKLMYKFVRQLTPEDVFIIARQLYLEMITAGYGWVGEFHYLHNDLDGTRFSRPAEMAEALLRAARETGIGICLLPVLYQRSGFDSNSVEPAQNRFALTLDEFFQLLIECQHRIDGEFNSTLGMAIHSLRAVSDESVRASLDFRASAIPNSPLHIHIAEQIPEVEQCLAATGMRPVDYLMSQFPVDDDWCLIHATHMTDVEVAAVAKSGAIAGLCPTTEANLGDGVFSALDFLQAGGMVSIGSDSHCSVDVRDELRTLEYGQRLKSHQRAVLGTNSHSVGRTLYEAAARGGAAAIGVPTGRLSKGCRADLIIVDDQDPTIAGASNDRLLDRFIFSNTGNPIARRMLAGKWIDESLAASLEQSRVDFYKLNQRLLGNL